MRKHRTRICPQVSVQAFARSILNSFIVLFVSSILTGSVMAASLGMVADNKSDVVRPPEITYN